MSRTEHSASDPGPAITCRRPPRSPLGGVTLYADHLAIRRLDVQDPVVLYRARHAADPDAWMLRCISNGALAEHALQQAMALADTTREISTLLDILSDWWIYLARLTRTSPGSDTNGGDAFRLRANEQMSVVTAQLDRLSHHA